MSALAWVKLIKWLGVWLFGAGVLGALLPRDVSDRRKAAYWLATPGILGVWMGGYGIARLMGISLGSPWISASMLLSLLSLQAVVWGVERQDRGRLGVAVVALVSMLLAFGLMIAQPGTKLQGAHELGATHLPVEEVKG